MSEPGSLLQKNLDALRASGMSRLADRFAEPRNPDLFTIEQARSGVPTLLFNGQAIHSKYDPLREASTLIAKLYPETTDDTPVVLVGMGLGYVAEALLEAVHGNQIVIVEPSEEVFAAALQVRDQSALIARSSFVVGVEIATAHVEGAESWPESPVLLTLPTVKLYAPSATDDVMRRLLKRASTTPKRLNILVVGALLGGSVPIGHYVNKALTQLGHRAELLDTTPFAPGKAQLESLTHNQQHKTALLNQYTHLLGQSVLVRAEEIKAQLVLFMAQSPGTREALDELRRAGIPTAIWFVEDGELFDYGLQVAPHYDVFFHIQKGVFEEKLRKAGARTVHYLPLAADPDVHRPLELSPADRQTYGSGLSHMGAGYFNRRRFFIGLTDYDFKLWGNEWDGAGLLTSHLQKNGERVNEAEIVRIFNATRINLNLHSSTYTEGVNPHGDFVNPRTFEIAACGGFQLVDERGLLTELFEPGKEVVTFSDLDSCRSAIDHYLSHPDEARAIAQAGRERVLAQHTYLHRMREALQIIAENCEFPAVEESPNTVKALVQEAGDDVALAEFFARMGRPDDVLTLEGVAEKILHEEGDLGETETLFLLMNEFGKWAKEKGVV